MNRGFSLMQVSILLVAASMTLVACLPTTQSIPASNNATTWKMNTIIQALRKFEVANARLPCPADASLPTGSPLYGVEAANAGIATNCAGGSPSANTVDTVNHIATGMLPLRALGLSNDYALDAWGRDFTYAVDTSATNCFNGTLPGAIIINDNGTMTNTVAALMSHGIDGHGSWLPLTGTSGTATHFNAGSTDATEVSNSHMSNSFLPVMPLTNFVRKPPTNTFDNLIAYGNPQWNLNTSPVNSAVMLPMLGAPANAIYISGQKLSFTLTYPKTVIVTGVPSLALTLGTSSHAASYVSGTGSNVLTFSYTLQTGDYAPTGVTIGSAVTFPTGSAISASCNNFIVPSLANVDVKKLYTYVTDYNNNRIEKFDASGNYLSQFGNVGTLPGLFSHPNQITVDASGNAWVTDWGNSRLQGFNASGSYVANFGSVGSLSGQLVNPGAVTTDASGNFWIADTGNNRLQKFNATGSYVSKFGSLGSGNGQFLTPSGIAIDGSGNLWVSDSGNNRIEKFSSTGAYLGKFGSYGTGNGQFVLPTSEAFDNAGNLWVVDSGNNRLQKFDSNGNYQGQFGSAGNGNGQFITPSSVTIDVAGNIWVVDSGNSRVQEFSSTGAYLGKFGSLGAGNGQFWTPAGITLVYQ